MTESIESRIKAMIVDRLFMKIAPGDIQDDKSLIDVYGVDSVSLLELVVGLEEEFDITVDDDDFSVDHFQTVTALAKFVRGKLGDA
jgi:acyl carrier protein